MGRPVSLIVRQDGPSWSAWSPQYPGLAMVQPATADLRAVLPEVLGWYFGEDARIEPRVHCEREAHGVVVRIAQDEHVYERELVAERLGEALGSAGQRARLSSATLGGGGGVTLVCALQSDRVSWLAEQMEEDDAVIALLPVAESMLWAVRFGVGDDAADGDEATVSLSAYPPSTTLGEILRTYAGPREHLHR
ncbi:conserved hypothetical protein [Frankia canadensis]|uniref:Uncharacterized protein n=1 Tax=Frankia canadensis TaxID=1836972 RepID=A0A2I2KX56_9ACTN|nr:hypothetical protein [Frankia canadensis]SNQ50245.1 conserved hypothetical protein [Frankia canadensis]SOU57535.1 conserved hypothetical protein [Frankia canadensis]